MTFKMRTRDEILEDVKFPDIDDNDDDLQMSILEVLLDIRQLLIMGGPFTEDTDE